MSDTEDIKRRRKLLERILKNWQAWGALVHSQGLFTLTIEGEEYHYYDMLESMKSLPPRQKQAVFLMCVEDKSEIETAAIMGFDNASVSPVQQYKSFALNRMLEYLDATPEIQKEMIEKVSKYGKKPRKKRVPKEKV